MENHDMMFGGGGWLFAFLIIAMMFGGGNLFGGGNNYNNSLHDAIDNQTTQNMLTQVLMSSQNNNYETAQLINAQTMAFMNQQNTNAINVLQGFNQLTGTITGVGNQLSQKLDQLGYQMESCCCSIKTQLLQDKYENLVNDYRTLQNDVSNANQTQTILNTMGKWIANAPAAAT